jgi:hypothetical protein
LRHTFSSHFLMNGASLKYIQELLGHKNIEMTLRYAHLSQEHKRRAVNLLNGLTTLQNETAANCHDDQKIKKKRQPKLANPLILNGRGEWI